MVLNMGVTYRNGLGGRGWTGEPLLSLRSDWNCILFDQWSWRGGARGNSWKIGAKVFENKQNTTGARGGVYPQ